MSTSTGLDVLLKDYPDQMDCQRVGLVTNTTGVTRTLRSNIDVMYDCCANLAALFSPEHGLYASEAGGVVVASSRVERTGLPIHSLYGETRKPTPEMLNGIDTMVFDIQDVGVRFYTYTATLALVMEACAENKIPLIVLDRPDAINGVTVEGPIIEPTLQSFVGHGPLPIRFGMTMGELARFYNMELNINADLYIFGLHDWKRAMWFDETGLPWVPPSPNMPRLSTAMVYPGMCLFEGTNLSIGRGTSLPFETIGAPWIDGKALADALTALKLDGVNFQSIEFTPSVDKYADQKCFGVQLQVTDRRTFRPVTAALHLLRTMREMYPTRFEWNVASFNRLMGDASVMEKIDRGESVSAIMQSWQSELDLFLHIRNKYLMYR